MQQPLHSGILRQLHLKVTPRRLEVMGCLSAGQTCLSADEVRERIKTRLGSIGLPTVYRILDELAGAGVVTRIFLSDHKQYFYLCSNPEHHHHFVCESCRQIEDIDQCGLDVVAREIASRSGARVTSHIMQINGVCGACGKREASI